MAVDTTKTMLSRSRELLDDYGKKFRHDMDTYKILDALWQTLFQMYVEGVNGPPGMMGAMSLEDAMRMAHDAGVGAAAKPKRNGTKKIVKDPPAEGPGGYL